MNKIEKSNLDNKMNNVINLNYTKEMEEKAMNEEKSMVPHNGKKGLFQWLKNGFDKLKDKFRPKAEIQKQADEGSGLTLEQMDVVTGGYPNPDVIDYGKLEEVISSLKEEKPWDLTASDRENVENGYAEIRRAGGKELTPEEADNIRAGQHIIEEEGYGK